MGACGSKDAIPKSSTRDLSRWKVDDDHQDGRADDSSQNDNAQAATSKAKQDLYRSSTDDQTASSNSAQLHVPSDRADLALNCVTYHPSFAETQACLTGWEDGSIRRFHWNATAASPESDAWKPHERAVNRIVVGRSAELIYSCSRDTTIALTSMGPPSSPPSSSAASPLKKKPNSVLLRGHNLNVATIAVDDSEVSLCSGGRDTQTIFWDLQTGRLKSKNTTSQNVVTCSKWIPGGEPLVVQGSEDLTLKLWDERTALRSPVQSFRGFVYFALSVDVTPDANYILTSSKGFNGVGCEVRVWDRRTAKQLHEFTGHQQDTTSCCFLPAAPDNRSTVENTIPIPVTASKDGTVKVWDVATSSALCEALEPSGGMFTSICAVSSSLLLASTFSGSVHTFEFDASEATIRRVA
ncbi:hypothetical protein Gpo141_00010396 [Globisporangium polare]